MQERSFSAAITDSDLKGRDFSRAQTYETLVIPNRAEKPGESLP